MTTIAYKDGILAGDGRITGDPDGHIWTDECRKVYKLKNGALFGNSGDDENGEILRRWVAEHGLEQFPKTLFPTMPEIYGLYITPEGKLYLSEGSIWQRWWEPFAAIGSGKARALTAMRLGHSAVEAVKAGIAGDAFSGGKVTFVTLAKKEKK